MPGGAHENMRGWSPEEDELLLQLIETKGKRWKLIAEALGNANQRTPAMVRNRYLRIERGRYLTSHGMSKNRCGQCGQLKRGHVCQAAKPVVGTDMEQQQARHHEARLKQLTSSASLSPSLGSPGVCEGVRGVPAGLTLVPLPHEDAMSLVSPGSFPVHSGASPGIYSLGNLNTPAGPPTLRPQNSMEILAQTAMTIEHMNASKQQFEQAAAAETAAAHAARAMMGPPTHLAEPSHASDTSSEGAASCENSSQAETDVGGVSTSTSSADDDELVEAEVAHASGALAEERAAAVDEPPRKPEQPPTVTPPPIESAVESFLGGTDFLGTDYGSTHRREALVDA